MNIAKISKALFYLIALWCVVVGSFNQTISGTSDFEWIAAALEGVDVSRFDPIMAIWAHWIGLFLITAGIALFFLTRVLLKTTEILIAASVLAFGTIGAQIFSAISLGASGPLLIVGALVLLCAVAAPILGFMYARTKDVRTKDA